MNGLSWLLYGAEFATRVQAFGTIMVILAVVAGFFWAPKGVAQFSYDHMPGTGFQRPQIWVAAIVGTALLLLVPSRDTIMLIAASEVGETVIASKEAQELGGEAGQLATDSLRLLRKYVTEQLAEDKPS